MRYRLKIRIYDTNKNYIANRIYTYNDEDILGEGSNGVVYQAEGRDQNETIQKYALKVIKKENFNKNEFDILKQFYFAEEPVVFRGYVYIIMEFIPGNTLAKESGQPNPLLAKFNLRQRLNLINQLLADFTLMHNARRTHEAIFHGDLKPANINITKNWNNTDARILDFGLSKQIKTNKNKFQISIPANPLYFPIETLQGSFGLKTDIYMLVHVIATILDDPDPLQLKIQESNKQKPALEIAATPYSLNIMAFPNLYLDVDFRDIMVRFLNQMQHNTIDDRPDIDEVFHFFTTFNHLIKLNEKNPESDQDIKKVLTAKLLIFSHGLDQSNIGTSSFFNPFEHFDFDAHLDFCDSIINNAKNNAIDQSIVNTAKNIFLSEKSKHAADLNLKCVKLIEKLDLQKYPYLEKTHKKHEKIVDQYKADAIMIDYEFKRSLYLLLKKIHEASKLANSSSVKNYHNELKATIEGSLIAFHDLELIPDNQIKFNKRFNGILRSLDEIMVAVHQSVKDVKTKEKILLSEIIKQFEGYPLYKQYVDKAKELMDEIHGMENKITNLLIPFYFEIYTNSREQTLFHGSPFNNPHLAWLEEKIVNWFPEIESTAAHKEISPTRTNKILSYLGNKFPSEAEMVYKNLCDFEVKNSTLSKMIFKNMANLLLGLGNRGLDLASQFFTEGKLKDKPVDNKTIAEYYDRLVKNKEQNKLKM